MRVKSVNAMEEPIAGEFFIIRRVAGGKREAPDKKEPQRQSHEQCREQVFVESF